jgi:hypothetical protein
MKVKQNPPGPTNQTTKKANKGRNIAQVPYIVPRYVDHSYVRNAFLEMANGALNYNKWCAYANEIFEVAENFFKQWAIATGRRLSYQATCLLWKGFWLDGSLAVKPRSVGIALPDGLCDIHG